MIREDLEKWYSIDALGLLQLLMVSKRRTMMCYQTNSTNIQPVRGYWYVGHEPLVISLQTIVILKDLEKSHKTDASDLLQLLMGSKWRTMMCYHTKSANIQPVMEYWCNFWAIGCIIAGDDNSEKPWKIPQDRWLWLVAAIDGIQATNHDVLPWKIRLKSNQRGGIDADYEPLVVSLQTIVIRKDLENDTG